MNQPSPLPLSSAIAGDTFRNLVRQFSQELCFYRELIQNALDAGTRQVEVSLEYLEDKKMAVVHVVDYGEGMDRKIIDTQLTRLFSSTKEGDFTKIGKFGIGFVSVFAIQPEAVVVDTGRSGEDWRVIFQPSGEFERVRLNEHVEGTQIHVYKAMSREEFPHFEKRSRETVEYWCRHSEVDIFFQGDKVNEPFDLASPIKIHRETQGTEIVAALVPDRLPFFGFYNGGITLLEGGGEAIPEAAFNAILGRHQEALKGVAFKIKSRYLEHTLTRDNVKQDQNFEKAMGILKGFVKKDLMEEMLRQVERLARGRDADYWTVVLRLALPHLKQVWPGHPTAAIVPRLGAGDPLSWRDLSQVRGKLAGLLHLPGWATPLLYDRAPNPVTQELEAQGIAVVEARADDLADILLRLLGGAEPVRACGLLARPDPVPEVSVPANLQGLAASGMRLLAQCGVRLARCTYARFYYPESSIAERPFLLRPFPGPLVLSQGGAALKEDEPPPEWPLDHFPRGELLLNVGHPLVTRLATAWEKDASAAAYILAKLICLADGLHPQMEGRLLHHSLQGRAHAGSA